MSEEYAAEQERLMVVPEAIDRRLTEALGKRTGFVLIVATESGIHIQSNMLPEAVKKFIRLAAEDDIELEQKTSGRVQ